MNGPQHYREAERLLAAADESTLTTYEGHNPEADRLIAEAHVHAMLAMTAAYALGQPIEVHGEGSHPSQEYYDEWVGAVEIDDEEASVVGVAAKAAAVSASPEAWGRLGRALRERRESMGLSRRALSEKCGVSETGIKNAEEGRVPSRRWPQSINRIASTLGWQPGAALQLVLTETSKESL